MATCVSPLLVVLFDPEDVPSAQVAQQTQTVEKGMDSRGDDDTKGKGQEKENKGKDLGGDDDTKGKE
jgi:hypothetical protein